MWRRTVLVLNILAIINRTSAQIPSNGTEVPAPKECCPCPPDVKVGVGLAAPRAEPGPESGAPGAAPAGPAVLGAAGADCLCQPRDADANGAPSLFLPNAVRAIGNVMRSDPAEDAKPLLQPEVDLASSVLETLKAATDEEYRDALERDAARAAAPGTEASDATPQESNVVTIIVSPKDMADDPISEASHVHTTRCIDSLLGSPRASFNRPPVHQRGLEEILNLPLPGGLLHRQRDSHLAASNVHESIVRADNNLNRALSGLRLRADSGLLNLDPQKISDDINKILNGQKLMLNNDNRRKSVQSEDVVTDTITNKINNDNTDDSVETDNIDKQSAVVEDIIDNNQFNLDTDQSPSNINGIFAEATENDERSLRNENSFPRLIFPKNPRKKIPLKNLATLKDQPTSKVNISSILLKPLQTKKARANGLNIDKLPKLSDLFIQPSKSVVGREKATQEAVASGNIERSVNIQTIPRKAVFKTEVLDAIPSTSENKPVALMKDNCLSSNTNSENLSAIKTSGDLFDKLNTDSDIVSKDENNVSFADDTQHFDANNGDIVRDAVLDGMETFDIIDGDQGLSNTEGLIISQEDTDYDPASVDLSELNRVEDRSNRPLKSLESIRNSVIEKLNVLQINNRRVLDNIKHSVEEIDGSNDSGGQQTQNSRKSSSPVDSVKDISEDVGTSGEEVTFQDLQKMSDSILSASEQQAKAVPLKDIEQENHVSEDLQSVGSTEEDFDLDHNEDDIDTNRGLDEDKRSGNKIRKPEVEMSPTGTNNSDYDENNIGEEINNLCPSDLIETTSKRTETKSFDENGNVDNDMATLASEPVINSLLRPNSKSLIEHLGDIESKLRQNIIVQPKSLLNTDDLNLFRTPVPNIPDISELPTLDEIRMRVSEILSGLARTSGDEDISSEFDSYDFASNNNPVISTSPSSSKSFLNLPPLKPLKDINLDIIQLKPLPIVPGLHPLKSEFPGLNLNTYKAKLSVPKSLDLKPLKLASTLGNDGGLVGATLSVGPERKVKTGKAKLKTKANSNSARNSLTLTDITTSIQNNARNLLNIPEIDRGQTLQASNVVENIAENLKSRTENAMRNIHESLNPPHLNTLHADLRQNTNTLLNSGRNTLGSLHTAAPINKVIDNLRSQTENSLRNVHQTLSSPKLADFSSTVQKSAEKILQSPLHSNDKMFRNKLQSSGSLDAALDSLKAQSQNTFRNIQQTLDTSPLEDLSKSIHKTILKSSPIGTSGNSLLKATPQPIEINEVVDNLRARTDSTLKNIQQTLHSPALSDISTSIHRSAQQILNTPDKLTKSLQTSSPLDYVVDNLKAHTQSTVSNIRNSLNTPALVDLSAITPTHAQNLLKSPVAMAGRNAFEQILEASPPVIDLTPHAEKAVKDLQKTIKATLKNSPIKHIQPLTDPNHVLQMISDHHEDVNDKLFALQTDFADRLESVHNDIVDPERLRSILSPPINRNFELFSIPLPNSRSSAPNLKKQIGPTLKTKQPSFDSQKKESRFRTTTVPKSDKPKLGTPKLGEKQTGTGRKRVRDRIKIFMPQYLASAPVPAKVKPSLSTSPIKPTILKPLLTDSFDPLSSGTESRKTYQPTTTRRPFVPKQKAQKKVPFGSAIPRPRPDLSPPSKRPPFVPSSKTPRPKGSNINRFAPKPLLVRQQTPWSPGSSSPSPTETADPPPSSRLAPLATKSKLATPMKSTRIEALPRLGSLSSLRNPLPKVAKPKLEIQPNLSKARSRSSNPDSKILNPSIPPTSLLSKLTEALKGKQSKGALGSPLQSTNQRLEMAPAASENMGSVVSIENPMKENVAYKCKMTCVKLE